jgi:hypothetical protein
MFGCFYTKDQSTEQPIIFKHFEQYTFCYKVKYIQTNRSCLSTGAVCACTYKDTNGLRIDSNFYALFRGGL